MLSFGAMASRQSVSPALVFQVLLVLLLAWAGPVARAAAQPPPAAPVDGSPPRPPTTPEPVERLGDNLFRVGNVRIDMNRREISVAGKVTDAQFLEFIAGTKGGFKNYETALELDTNAINFNLALILIGLDKANSVGPKVHFDPDPPQGDPVEIWVEWDADGARRRVPAEHLVYNDVTKTTLPEGPWVYTGSVFMAETNAYLADIDGTLIGFVHTPSPIIENPAPIAPGGLSANKINPALKLAPETPVVVTVRALPRPE